MKKFNLLALAAILALTTACATERLTLSTSDRISPDAVNQIKKGQSRKDDVTRLFGQPLDNIQMPDGEERWFYKDFNLHSLYLTFSANGVVETINYD